MSLKTPSKEQEDIFDLILNHTSNALIDAKAGTGKCLGIDTKILMYDGSIKNVQDIVVGDVLMGDDSQPRNVLSTNTGKGQLFEVKPNREKSFICNDVHVLTLNLFYKNIVNCKVDIALDVLLTSSTYNYKNKNNIFTHYSLYKQSIDFSNENNYDYYSIGNNFFNQEFTRKHILTTTENRYKILTGIVDRYCIIQFNELKLKNNIVTLNYNLFKELLDSLGCVITYYDKGVESYIIKGDFNKLILKDNKKKKELNIENKKNYNFYKFSIEPVGEGYYYGFTLDGNGRFLLDNYIVTHNTTTIVESINRILNKDEDKNINLVAFNKHISNELKEKIPESKNIFVSTTHGIGYGAIKRKNKNKEIIIDNNKIYKIVNKRVGSWGLNPIHIDINQYKSNIVKIVSLCKVTLSQTIEQVRFISNKYGYKVDDMLIRRVRQVLEESVRDITTYDYDDMIYLPAIDKKYFIFPADYVFVDECVYEKQKLITDRGNMSIKKLFDKSKEKYKRMPKALSYNEETKTFEYKRVKKIWKNIEKKTIISLKTNNGVYKTSDIHPYLTTNGWKKVKDINENDFIITHYERGGTFLPNYDQRKFIQACLMTRYHKRVLPELKSIVYENRISDNTLDKHRDYYMMFNTYVYSKEKTMNRLFSSIIYFEDYNYDKIDFLNKMDVKDLAIIYMDSNIIFNSKDSISISADNYDFLLVYKKIIEDKFGLSNLEVKKIKQKKYKLTVNENDQENFWNLIKPYLLEQYLEDEILEKSYIWKLNDDMIPVSIVLSKKISKRQYYTYDMTIEDNHNFVLTNSIKNHKLGIVAHNCQDYNKAQQYILKKMLKKDTGRLIAFGDKNQAIYSFMGADIESFNWFRDRENTKTLPLSTSYRCSKKIIELAQTLVPDIHAKHDAEEGRVRLGSVVDEAEAGDFVLARKNSPFITLIFDLLDKNKIATIRGKEIGETIKNKLLNYKNFKEITSMINNTINETIMGLLSMGITDPQNHPQYLTVKDNMDIIRKLMERTGSVGELMSKIDHIFSDKPQGIILSTIHKSKGLEANRVFIIRPDQMKIKSSLAWMWQGELNLEYIAYTRAKNEIIMDQNWTDENR